jgi:hypothetical protein
LISGLFKVAIVVCAGLVAFVVAGVIIVHLVFRHPGFLDLALHWGQYETIVEAAKRYPLPPGQTVRLKIERSFNGSSWSAVPVEGEEFSTVDGAVTLERNAEGFYRVTFVTVDNHHAGFGGYIFQDKGILAAPVDAPWEPGNTVQHLLGGWYSFYNNED